MNIAEVNAPAVNARLERDAAQYRENVAALGGAAEVIDTDYRGTPAKIVDGSYYVAISTTARRNGAEWAILRNGDDLHVDNVVCYLKRAEVANWLRRTA